MERKELTSDLSVSGVLRDSLDVDCAGGIFRDGEKTGATFKSLGGLCEGHQHLWTDILKLLLERLFVVAFRVHR